MKVALLCGGPSLERGISLNSARTVLDHLDSPEIEIIPFYFDQKKKVYKISKAQLYSNTPSDFDFKLKETAEPLSKKEFIKELRMRNIAFPVMHGRFGEDGKIQEFLEKNKIPFVGSPSEVCKNAFDKFKANEFIRKNGFFASSSISLSIYEKKKKEKIKDFFEKNKIKRAVVKPAKGGSSIGVFSVENEEEAYQKAEFLFSKRMDTKVVLESFAEGVEFTTIIIENRFFQPVSILPTEIETDYTENQIFDFRKKYLPTRQVTYHCPPRFRDEYVFKIQKKAEQLFSLFGFRDFARFDGWLFENGDIWFSDFNPVSGMEQNSFLFQQSSRLGFSHGEFLRYILKNSCKRQSIDIENLEKEKTAKTKKEKRKIKVFFGGKTSERQVSLMSGTNVWLKLKNREKYEPAPFLLGKDSFVWELPYSYTLNHTVEEIEESCKNAEINEKRLSSFIKKAFDKLELKEGDATQDLFLPKKKKLKEFLSEDDFVFLALHGGDGEDGSLQKIMEKKNIPFNGSGGKTSKLCMNKWETGEFIKSMNAEGLSSTVGEYLTFEYLKENFEEGRMRDVWLSLVRKIGSRVLIIKPVEDGCSTGIVRLSSSIEMKKYLEYLLKGEKFIPKNVFKGQGEIIHMPEGKSDGFIFESFIETEKIRVKSGKLKHFKRSGWIEVTIGILEKGGEIKVFDPSITIAEGAVLSVEEKFQGGTGINLTPPPAEIVSCSVIKKSKVLIEKLSREIGLRGYARVDAFLNINSGNLKIIEVNTLPALTPSTVLFHQALNENPPIYPLELIEKIIENTEK